MYVYICIYQLHITYYIPTSNLPATCSCASSSEPPNPDTTIIAASGSAPRIGSTSPPMSPGSMISRSSSELKYKDAHTHTHTQERTH